MSLVIETSTGKLLGQLLRERISRDGGLVAFDYLTANGVQTTTDLTAHIEVVK